jgi:hypothetical protein
MEMVAHEANVARAPSTEMSCSSPSPRAWPAFCEARCSKRWPRGRYPTSGMILFLVLSVPCQLRQVLQSVAMPGIWKPTIACAYCLSVANRPLQQGRAQMRSASNMWAVVLVGGDGSRLRDITTTAAGEVIRIWHRARGRCGCPKRLRRKDKAKKDK